MGARMNRRSFLRGTAGAMLAVPALPLLQGCEPASRTNQSAAGVASTLIARIGSRLTEVLRLAALAPSAHNAQPWNVTIETRHQWRIGSDRRRWLPAVDPENREMLLAIGAFLENLIVAAKSWGYEVDYRVIAATPFDPDLIAINLAAAAPMVNGIEAIRRRRTLRKGFDTREIRAADFSDITHGLAGFSFHGCGTAPANYLVEGTLEANRTQAARSAAREELASWIRWSDEEAEHHLNGLTPASMEIEGFAGWYVRNFYTRNDVMTDAFRKTTLDQVAAKVRNCGGWIVMTSEGNDVAGLIEAGRSFQRFFLRVRDKRIAVHPMSQLLEEPPWRSDVATQLGLDEPLQFILRVGYRDPYPAPVSLRMPLAAFVRA